ncbi:MAG TPA: transposase [Thermoplasmata archaeon]|nr:transposase [Thermoplasmata archaeon]
MTGLHDRVERAEVIARLPGQIEKVTDSVYSVKAQSGDGVYLVSSEAGRWKCLCPDYNSHNLPCKHILAVRLKLKGITTQSTLENESKRPRHAYGQNWPAYNAAQMAQPVWFGRVLPDLVADLEDPTPPKSTGRPRLPFRDLVYCAVERVYLGNPLRVADGTYARSKVDGLIECTPRRTTISALLGRADVTPILTELIEKSSLALASVETTFAVDSSGFRTTAFGDYCREKYGAPSHNVWKKLSIIVGTKTHIIPRVIVSDGHAADCPQFPGLVNGVVDAGFVLKEVYADKGYLSGENFNAVGEAGGTPFIMFKENSRGRAKRRRNHSPWWKQMWHRFQSNPSEFLDHYHKRENVEATFAAMKRKLGETLGSKNPTAQVNELLCKVLAYNITVLIHESFERGIPLPSNLDQADNRPKNEPTLTIPANLDLPVAPPYLKWQGEDN